MPPAGCRRGPSADPGPGEGVMRNWAIALFVTAPLFGSGCSFAQNIRRNMVFSPLYAYTNVASHHRNMQLGREAWRQMVAAYPDRDFSCDYRRGFVDGYAGYLDYGGGREPPSIPPPSHRLFRCRPPEVLAAMEDSKVGFRHGAATAKASGLRKLITIP